MKAKLTFAAKLKGLLDADDQQDFLSKLTNVKLFWNNREKQYLPSGTNPKFFQYIFEKVSTSLL